MFIFVSLYNDFDPNLMNPGLVFNVQGEKSGLVPYVRIDGDDKNEHFYIHDTLPSWSHHTENIFPFSYPILSPVSGIRPTAE